MEPRQRCRGAAPGRDRRLRATRSGPTTAELAVVRWRWICNSALPDDHAVPIDGEGIAHAQVAAGGIGQFGEVVGVRAIETDRRAAAIATHDLPALVHVPRGPVGAVQSREVALASVGLLQIRHRACRRVGGAQPAPRRTDAGRLGRGRALTVTYLLHRAVLPLERSPLASRVERAAHDDTDVVQAQRGAAVASERPKIRPVSSGVQVCRVRTGLAVGVDRDLSVVVDVQGGGVGLHLPATAIGLPHHGVLDGVHQIARAGNVARVVDGDAVRIGAVAQLYKDRRHHSSFVPPSPSNGVLRTAFEIRREEEWVPTQHQFCEPSNRFGACPVAKRISRTKCDWS